MNLLAPTLYSYLGVLCCSSGSLSYHGEALKKRKPNSATPSTKTNDTASVVALRMIAFEFRRTGLFIIKKGNEQACLYLPYRFNAELREASAEIRQRHCFPRVQTLVMRPQKWLTAGVSPTDPVTHSEAIGSGANRRDQNRSYFGLKSSRVGVKTSMTTALSVSGLNVCGVFEGTTYASSGPTSRTSSPNWTIDCPSRT